MRCNVKKPRDCWAALGGSGDIGAAKTEQWLTTQAYIECDTGGNNSNLFSSLHNEGIEKSGKLAIVCLENMVALKYALS